MNNRTEMSAEDERLFNAAWVEALKTRPVDPNAFLAGWQAARANPVPANELEADAIAWRTLVRNAEDGAHVYPVGRVTYADKAATLWVGSDDSDPHDETTSIHQHPIVQAVFRWVNPGDCPTLLDALLALAKRNGNQG